MVVWKLEHPDSHIATAHLRGSHCDPRNWERTEMAILHCKPIYSKCPKIVPILYTLGKYGYHLLIHITPGDRGVFTPRKIQNLCRSRHYYLMTGRSLVVPVFPACIHQFSFAHCKLLKKHESTNTFPDPYHIFHLRKTKKAIQIRNVEKI